VKLGATVAQYIAYRRALGDLYITNGRMLEAFARVTGADMPLNGVRPKQVRRFLSGKGPVTANWHAKFNALRVFYDYAISRGYVTASPLPKVVPKRPPPFVPYIYSLEELRALLKACLTYQKRSSRIDPTMMRTLLLSLYGTGLRIREAIRLTLEDVDLNENVLTIRQTKFRKTRIVPFGPLLATELRCYAVMRRRRDLPQQPNAPFFITRDGRHLSQQTIEMIFQRVRDKARVRRSDGARYQPRLHDLRHSFAVHRLISWYKQGVDVQTWLPVLSTYLGHAHLSSTSAYLTMTPALLGEANLRFQKYAFPEHRHG
jgi:integrase/recombinase XerD